MLDAQSRGRAPPTRANASLVPSGDQAGEPSATLRFSGVTARAAAPSSTMICEAFSDGLLVYASRVPSGDHRGSPRPVCGGGATSTCAALPSARAVQMPASCMYSISAGPLGAASSQPGSGDGRRPHAAFMPAQAAASTSQASACQALGLPTTVAFIVTGPGTATGVSLACSQ